ncbi:MAG: N-formylglutamate amidohydrolase [Devosia sp.]|uniref:N-formylglutamate amidohydrolase n=1 Tax=Devosia sp. TaxID=1871048 RepID=UPI00262F9B71|nr:N-formylglutamate amidohydrolase [Devosia sp.]MDB5528242.1 N-formylglutamate amidohydrolase [Devosia sp.]
MLDDRAEVRREASQLPPAITINSEGRSPFVLVCDHASNRVPERYGDLGLSLAQRLEHIAWDPGALSVCQALVDLLDAPLVHSTVSRLIIDCNRDTNSPELIRTLSEATVIAANIDVSPEERARRIGDYHAPFHLAIERVLDQRAERGLSTVLVCMHSFTPIYLGVPRPWPIGLIHGRDTGYTQKLFDALKAEDPALDLGWNQPYAALNGVTLTLERHGDGRGLDATMIEIRNNEILEPAGVAFWAARLARSLTQAHEARSRTAAR